MAIVILNSILFISLQVLLQVQVAVIVPATITLNALAFMCLEVVHLPMMYGLGILPAPLNGHVAANSRFLFDVVYLPSL